MKPNGEKAVPWNKSRLVGQKSPLKLKEICAIRARLQLAGKTRDLALFNLAVDSKLRGCDLVSLKVGDVAQGITVLNRAIVMQQKTRRPVQFGSPNKHGSLPWNGSTRRGLLPASSSFQAGLPTRPTFRPANTPALLQAG
jgi:hypothetical protein